jgi:hypothetical protein
MGNTPAYYTSMETRGPVWEGTSLVQGWKILTVKNTLAYSILGCSLALESFDY